MNNSLKRFYDNETEREDVKAFMIECLKEQAVELTFEGQDVSGIKEARLLIERMFDRLETLYANKPKPIVSDSK